MKDTEGTPSNAELLKLAEKCPPPAEWYEEDFSDLFGDDDERRIQEVESTGGHGPRSQERVQENREPPGKTPAQKGQ